LGILTAAQIERGHQLLSELSLCLSQSRSTATGGTTLFVDNKKIEKLSNDFYSAIPQHIGHLENDVANAIINTPQAVEAKQELLQLMLDVINVRILFCRSTPAEPFT